MLKLKSYFKSSVCFMAPDGSGGGGAEPSGGGSASPTTAPSTPSGSDSSPGTSSPSSSPSGAPSTQPASPASPASAAPEQLPDDPFAGFGRDDDGDEPAIPSAPKPPVVAAPAPVVDPKAPPAVPQPPAPEAPPQAPQQPQGQTGPQGASQPPIPSPAEPQKMSQAILSNLEDFANHLAASPEFAMSEADIEAFNTDITKALPQFAARVYLRAQASALSQMERVVPAMVQRYMKVSAARESSQGEFYKRWPQIDQSKHGDVVNRMAQTYRQENPQASLAEMVEALGPYVMMAAKIPHNPGAAPNGNPQPHVASSPMRPVGNRPPASPFVPAVGGPASPPQATEENPWMGFGASEDE